MIYTGWWFGTFVFPYIGNVIIPTDELIFFRGVGQPPISINIVDGKLPGFVLEKEASREASQTVQENPTADFFWCNMGLCKIRVPNPVLAPILLYISPLLGKARASH